MAESLKIQFIRLESKFDRIEEKVNLMIRILWITLSTIFVAVLVAGLKSIIK